MLEKVTGWVTSHPYATAGVGLILLYVLYSSSKGGSSSGGGSYGATDIALAQLQLQDDVMNAQFTSAEHIEQTRANAAVQIATLQGQTQSQAISAAQDVYNNAIDTEGQVSTLEANNALKIAQTQADTQKALIPLMDKSLDISKRSNRGDVGLNELALLTGQGNVASYNQKVAVEKTASANMWSNIVGGISKFATGLFL